MGPGGSLWGRIAGSQTDSPMATFNCEITDTFAGEANYSWVRRETIEVPDNASDLVVVRRAKSALGLTNIKCRKSDYGDMIELRPYGMAQVAFITFER